VASLLVAIPSAVATSFLAEGSGAHGATGPHLRRAFGLALVLLSIWFSYHISKGRIAWN